VSTAQLRREISHLRERRPEERASANKGLRRLRYELESYFRALENLERKEAGLPPLPYTEEDRKSDEEFLRETLPFYRASPGWQTEEAKRVLDEWERDTHERLQRGAHY
jgi:hypothetical protein